MKGWRLDFTDDEIALIHLGLGKAHQAQDILGDDLYKKLCQLEESIRHIAIGKSILATRQNPMRLNFEDLQSGRSVK